jgi:hypothetical protein
LEALPLLVEAGLELNRKGLGAWPPLFYAVRTGHVNIVSQLLKYGANPNVSGKGQWTPLHVAAQSHCKKVLRELLLYGANPHVLTEYEQSPFSLSRGTVPRDREMEVPTLLREWLIDCFARAIIAGFAKSEMSDEMFKHAIVSKKNDEVRRQKEKEGEYQPDSSGIFVDDRDCPRRDIMIFDSPFEKN